VLRHKAGLKLYNVLKDDALVLVKEV